MKGVSIREGTKKSLGKHKQIGGAENLLEEAYVCWTAVG